MLDHSTGSKVKCRQSAISLKDKASRQDVLPASGASSTSASYLAVSFRSPADPGSSSFPTGPCAEPTQGAERPTRIMSLYPLGVSQKLPRSAGSEDEACHVPTNDRSPWQGSRYPSMFVSYRTSSVARPQESEDTTQVATAGYSEVATSPILARPGSESTPLEDETLVHVRTVSCETLLRGNEAPQKAECRPQPPKFYVWLWTGKGIQGTLG
ncbi:hypothetical protein QBC40DRAFT_349946 [Triangularia verruculosa]|uniref:Uncharacterized protein n=1 Tax=Triangularia verruculosa TaxID=2587418 RepID=A0AAN6XFP5_9PEZI|nr:hypothetical protein QBC40DRAFT_349946 [Triangularia verruculosa]